VPARGVSALTHDDATSYTPPAAFGPFRVLHQIGIGVLGPVFRTYEPGRDRLVSVKVFRIDLLPEQASALAEALQGLVEIDLDHPAIVKPLAAGLEGHTVYLAEEYVAAESLDVALKHYAPAPLERALPFLGQLAGAIDFARARGVGHGSLHPRDIFVTPELARATGFGIVQALERLDVRAPVRRPYSAPERVAGASWSTPADVFALAAVAHELLTGRRPAGNGEVAAIAGRAAESNPELLRGVLARALAEDPAARYPTASVFVNALKAAAGGAKDESGAVLVPAWSEPSEVAPAAARELAVELDQDAMRAAEPADLDLRVPEEERTYDLGRIDSSKGRLKADPADSAATDSAEAGFSRPVEPPEPIECPAPSAEPREEPKVRRRRPRPRPSVEDPVAVSEEPPLFDLDTGDAAPANERAAFSHVAQVFSPAEGIEPEDTAQDLSSAPIAELREEPVADLFEEPPVQEVPADEPRYVEDERLLLAGGAVDRGRPAILPYAIVAMVTLLAGFLAGYVFGSRDRETPAAPQQVSAPSRQTTTPAQPATAQATPSPARPTQREWSESRVEPAPVPVQPPPAPADAPPVVARKAPAPTATPPKKPVPAPRAQASTPAPAPAPATGTIVAASRPAGARVIVDGKVVGKTPFKLAHVKAGTHTVRLELDGYRAWVSEITVTGGRETRVAGSLEAMRK
jgi:serine/threonine protein kinase